MLTGLDVSLIPLSSSLYGIFCYSLYSGICVGNGPST